MSPPARTRAGVAKLECVGVVWHALSEIVSDMSFPEAYPKP